jgi:hypothetical protein
VALLAFCLSERIVHQSSSKHMQTNKIRSFERLNNKFTSFSIVFEDCDFEAAVSGSIPSSFANQVCFATQ